jgi:cellobiose phosphorylase
MFYRHSWWDQELNCLIANKHPYYRPHDYLVGFLAADYPFSGFEGNLASFVGTYQNLSNPETVVSGQCRNTPGSADATVMAGQMNLQIAPKGMQPIEIMIGATDAEQQIPVLKTRYFGHFDRNFEMLKDQKRQMVIRNQFHTPDADFNRLFNVWVKQGATYGATWCRWGWMGYRDIVQHGLGILPLKPERTREIILEAMRYQYANGLALRGWNPVDEKPYSDSALWLVFTLTGYLKETGDFALLEEIVPYYDGGEGRVKSHVEQALNFLEANKGAHGLCLIKFGDWNDSLTAVGKEGRGESVMLSQTYAEALKEMSKLAGYLGDSAQKAEYDQRRRLILKAIDSNAWDGQWYTRCFDDNGRAIGSHQNQYGKMFLEPQAWGMISGAADSEKADQLLTACDEILGTPLGYRLLAPTFSEIDDHIGRISSMEPGICENGTIYTHLNIWMILGLLRMGKADEAYALFRKNAPGIYSPENQVWKQNSPPYMYANCYYGPDHRNKAYEMEFTWITGSLAWLNSVFLNEMIGAQAAFGGLRIDPCLPSTWRECRVVRYYRGAVYDIQIQNPSGIQQGDLEIRLDGEALDGQILPLSARGQRHRVEVLLKPAD